MFSRRGRETVSNIEWERTEFVARNEQGFITLAVGPWKVRARNARNTQTQSREVRRNLGVRRGEILLFLLS